MLGKKQIMGPGQHKPTQLALISVVWIYIAENVGVGDGSGGWEVGRGDEREMRI